MLGLRIQTFSLPKQDHQQEEYEDAWACNTPVTRLALADGASDAFESRLWAQALVQAFIREPPAQHCETLLDWLATPTQVWKEGIHWERLPWYAEEKARRGAFATLLGVSFAWPGANSTGEAGAIAQWQAIALGDVCLFQIRGEEVMAHFPIEQATDFGTTPPLLSTRLEYNRRTLEALRTSTGECQPGDLFVLATDALAAWFLRQVEGGERPWQYLVGLTDDIFTTLVTCLRQDGAMRNDDVTLVIGWVEDIDTTFED
jgi:hypothetical protein